MDTAPTVAELRARVALWRGRGERVGLVPTMGALHDGHMALVGAARAANERVVVSIFVNPKQFGPSEDLAAYPRPEAADRARLEGARVDLVFMPSVAEMYPPGFATTVSVAGLGEGLCGAHRPGHFDGVSTVVAKLLVQALPDAAYFGEKDWQQLTIVRRMARDLDLPVEIAGVPTVRESDGLAMSSRNAYLTPAERRVAPALFRTLQRVAGEVARRPGAIPALLQEGIAELQRAGFMPEYLELRDAVTLTPVTGAVSAPARLVAAARLGRARLIDNVPVSPS